MANTVKGKLVSGGSSVRVGRRVYPVKSPGKGEQLNLPAIRANDGWVEGRLKGGTGSGVGGKTGQAMEVFELDRKFLKNPIIT